MGIDQSVLYDLAFLLTLIPECPQGENAIDAIAADLDRLCGDEAEARAIVTKARDHWERWKGSRGLIELIDAGRPAPMPSNQAQDLGPRPQPDCAVCADWGYFSTDTGKVEWCDCAAGRETRQRFPGFTDQLSRKQIKPIHEVPAPAAPPRPITQADIDQAFADRQDRTEQMIAEARQTLASPDASRDRKEIAREVLRRFGA